MIAFNNIVHKINEAFKNQYLPGKKAHHKLAPSYHENLNVQLPINKAAVLILCYPKNNNTYIPFFKRKNNEKSPHAGQISLPGGRFENSDLCLRHTALRETHEEIGIIIDDVVIAGQLSELLIPISGYLVTPFVGYITYCPTFLKNSAEMEYLIEAPITEFLHQENLKHDEVVINNRNEVIPYYEINREKIWGATAMIISEFIDMIFPEN